jgi:hypothetical protein
MDLVYDSFAAKFWGEEGSASIATHCSLVSYHLKIDLSVFFIFISSYLSVTSCSLLSRIVFHFIHFWYFPNLIGSYTRIIYGLTHGKQIGISAKLESTLHFNYNLLFLLLITIYVNFKGSSHKFNNLNAYKSDRVYPPDLYFTSDTVIWISIKFSAGGTLLKVFGGEI